jgi:hypothetical protein
LKKKEETALLQKYAGFETELWLEIATKHAWAINLRDEVQQLAQAGGKTYSPVELENLFAKYTGNEVQLLRAVYKKYHLQNPQKLNDKLQIATGKRFTDRQLKALKGKEGFALQQFTQAYFLGKPLAAPRIETPITTPKAVPLPSSPKPIASTPIALPAATFTATPPQTQVPNPVHPQPTPAVNKPTPAPLPVLNEPEPRNKTGLIVGISLGVLLLVLTSLGLVFRKELGLLFASDAERMAHKRIEQLGQQKSEGSSVVAKDFFDEDELLQMAQDSSLTEKPAQE